MIMLDSTQQYFTLNWSLRGIFVNKKTEMHLSPLEKFPRQVKLKIFISLLFENPSSINMLILFAAKLIINHRIWI